MDTKDLELLANACNHQVFGFDKRGNACIDPVDYVPWNPEKHNRDAFEVMVLLQLNTFNNGTAVLIKWDNPQNGEFQYASGMTHERNGKDPLAATRKAIVAAALLKLTKKGH